MSDEMKRYSLKLVKVTQVGTDYYIFDFEKPEGIAFKEGQYGVFMHVDKEITGRKVRAFSIASSNDENIFKLATKIVEEPSDFKNKMLLLKIGDLMTFDGPMGSFTLEQDYDSVFIAGGIGITPIRGVIKQIEFLKFNKEVELIYSEPRSIYPFKEEFDEMNFVNAHYLSTVEATKEAINCAALKYLNTAFYYVSGSPGFVSSVSEQLKELSIETSQIKFDRFNGY